MLGGLALGGVAATTVVLLHGLVDVLLYSSLALPLMFLPMDWPSPHAKGGSQSGPCRRRRCATRSSNEAAGDVVARHWGSGFVSLGVLISLLGNTVAAMWYANLGSVNETRVELGSYKFPDALVEYVRNRTDLSTATAYFDQALALDLEM